MREFNLQVILDRGILWDRNILKIANDIIDGGAACIQLRNKVSSDKIFLEEAQNIRRITGNKGCLFIVNDRIDIAIASSADGVHLGQKDMPYNDARRLLGTDKIIGISTHDIEQARAAQSAGADYIGVGPIFTTRTKPELEAIGLDMVSAISKEIKIPSLFIGGINLENIDKIIKRGGRHVAVASAILNSDDIPGATKSFLNRLKETGKLVAA